MEENLGGEELDNIVILNDEEGKEVKFEFLDLVELDDEEYVVLLPVSEEGEEEEGEEEEEEEGGGRGDGGGLGWMQGRVCPSSCSLRPCGAGLFVDHVGLEGAR